MFFDIFKILCHKKGVSPNKALVDCGISRTLVAKWKKGAIPNGSTLEKLANYFNVTTDYLMGSTTAAKIVVTESKLADLRTALETSKDPEREELGKQIEDLEKFYRDLIEEQKSEEPIIKQLHEIQTNLDTRLCGVLLEVGALSREDVPHFTHRDIMNRINFYLDNVPTEKLPQYLKQVTEIITEYTGQNSELIDKAYSSSSGDE